MLAVAPSRDKPQSQGMTHFGRTLYALMLERGIEQRQELAQLLSDGGYRISQQTISNYMNGKRDVDPEFPSYVSEALQLDDLEQAKLAKAFTYGQTRLTEENQQRIKDFRRHLRAVREESGADEARGNSDGGVQD